jgi:hypothetical protein
VLLAAAHGYSEPTVLRPADYKHHVDKFNAADAENVVNLIPNAKAWEWMMEEIPWFDCPSAQFEETYYFRWWSFRKHVKRTEDGLVLTEFITPVGHAGKHNTIACAYGHHLAEGRWLREQKLFDEYTFFWFRSGPNGTPAPHFHKFSSWAATALYERYLVTGDKEFLIDLLDDLVADYQLWVTERGTPDGMFWQFDVRDGMEESISGSRHVQNIRPTINSYMAANARAISEIAKLAGRSEIADEFSRTAQVLRDDLNSKLWDADAKFYKVKSPEGKFSDAREEIGFIPWMFDLADDHAVAWLQLKDREGFWAPWGITTAERRHPAFRTHGTGTCEWDGAVWPFATSQTLTGLANLLRGQEQDFVSKRDYFEQLLTYARSHQQDGVAYIGEYLDETTGNWLITGEKANRSRFYNHSTFCDLVISGLVGIVPRDDDLLEVSPLLPDDAWDWFCLDGVPYRGHDVTVIWDRTGKRYGKGTGLIVFVDGNKVAQAPGLDPLVVKLSP